MAENDTLPHELTRELVLEDSDHRTSITLDGKEFIGDYELAKSITEKLMAHYPGHPWAVNVSHEQGVAIIRHMALGAMFSEGTAGLQHLAYYFKINSLAHDPQMNVAVQGAGELLEFYNVERRGLRSGDLEHAKPSETAEFFGKN